MFLSKRVVWCQKNYQRFYIHSHSLSLFCFFSWKSSRLIHFIWIQNHLELLDYTVYKIFTPSYTIKSFLKNSFSLSLRDDNRKEKLVSWCFMKSYIVHENFLFLLFQEKNTKSIKRNFDWQLNVSDAIVLKHTYLLFYVL